ncbi:MAG: HAD-IC family P-type ATPase, partial [Clostridia bacterium]|nr:HAD-IC family P-type ATPase [Clostridia bacterium]
GSGANKSIRRANYRLCVMGQKKNILAEELKPGDMIELLPGEIIPTDGVVAEGESSVSLKEIDGNSKLIVVHRGDSVVSGTTVMSGSIVVRVTATCDNSTVAHIVNDHATLSESVTPHEKMIGSMINRITLAFFCLATGISTLVAILTENFEILPYCLIWICLLACTDSFRMLLHSIYVVASMRCVNSGVVAKNKKLIEKSIFVKNLLFRKQGVLTDKKASVVKTVPAGGVSSSELLTYAAFAQYKASHSLTQALSEATKAKISDKQIAHFMETDDNGAMVQLKNGIEIITGNKEVLENFDVVCSVPEEENILCVAVDNKFVGYIQFGYTIKDDIALCVDSLKRAGAKNLTIITKDAESTAKDVAEKSGIENYIFEETREGIEERVKEFGKNTVYIGYGKGVDYDFGDECVKLMYGGFRYDTGSADGVVVSESLDSILKFFNIIKDTRWLFVENLVLCVLQVLLLVNWLLSGSQSIILGGVMFLILEGARKFNCFRFLKKL